MNDFPAELIPTVEKIRAAYDQLATRPGDWVRLCKLRPLIAPIIGAVREQQAVTQALIALALKVEGVHLAPIANRRAMDVGDTMAAVNLAGEDQHLLVIEAE